MKYSYKLGDPCWIKVGGDGLSEQTLHEGRVVASMTIPNHPTTFYVIELADKEHLHLEIRDALLMSDAADKLPPFNGDPVPDGLFVGVGEALSADDTEPWTDGQGLSYDTDAEDDTDYPDEDDEDE